MSNGCMLQCDCIQRHTFLWSRHINISRFLDAVKRLPQSQNNLCEDKVWQKATCRTGLELQSSLTWNIQGDGVIFERVEETIKQLNCPQVRNVVWMHTCWFVGINDRQTETFLQVSTLPHRHRVSLQDGVHLAEVEELVLLQVARLRPRGVQHRGCMTLRRRGWKKGVRVWQNAPFNWPARNADTMWKTLISPWSAKIPVVFHVFSLFFPILYVGVSAVINIREQKIKYRSGICKQAPSRCQVTRKFTV